MSAIDKIAWSLNIRNDVPNQELARELAENNDKKGIKEIAVGLSNKEKNVQSDCIKVLYEIGYIKPELISDYHNEFFNLLKSKNNRLVWGSMIGLMTIARIKAGEIWHNLELVIDTIDNGSQISKDAGVMMLATVGSVNQKYNEKIFPYLLSILSKCRTKDIPSFSEKVSVAVTKSNKEDFISVLEKRKKETEKQSQLKRIDKVLLMVSKIK